MGATIRGRILPRFAIHVKASFLHPLKTGKSYAFSALTVAPQIATFAAHLKPTTVSARVDCQVTPSHSDGRNSFHAWSAQGGVPLQTTPASRFGCVLIVDENDDSADVLRAVFQRRGVQIHQTPRPSEGLDLVREHHPDVILLDLESLSHDGQEICTKFADEARDSASSLVVLGNVRRARSVLPEGEAISKPYHFAPLIRRIEALLDASPIAKEPE